MQQKSFRNRYTILLKNDNVIVAAKFVVSHFEEIVGWHVFPSNGRNDDLRDYYSLFSPCSSMKSLITAAAPTVGVCCDKKRKGSQAGNVSS